MLLHRLLTAMILVPIGLSSLALAQQGEPLPEPPRPPRSARVQPPAEPVPPPPPSAAVVERPLTYGSIVSDSVSLYPYVRVKDADDMCPDGVSVVIAVRDPNCRRGETGFVFVKVCVPPCNGRVRVNKWGTEVELDYGEYEVEIKSRNGLVTVDYDD